MGRQEGALRTMEELNATSKQGRGHKVMVLGRKTCAINGVVDVLAFDLNEILLETEQGMLLVKGSELHVTRLTLDKGEVDVEGKVDSLSYSEMTSAAAKTESFFGKLFR